MPIKIKTIFTGCALALVLFWGTRGVLAQSAIGNYPDDKVTLHAQNYGIQYSIPATDFTTSIIPMKNMPSPNAFGIYNSKDPSVMVALFENYTQNKSLEEIYQDDVADLKRTHPDAVIEQEKQELQLNGGIRALAFVARKPSKKTVEKHLLFIHSGKAFYLSFGASDSTFGNHRQAFGDILRSFVFTPPNPVGAVVVYDGPKRGGLTLPSPSWKLVQSAKDITLTLEDENNRKYGEVQFHSFACPITQTKDWFPEFQQIFLNAFKNGQLVTNRATGQIGSFPADYFVLRAPSEGRIYRVMLAAHGGWCHGMHYAAEETRFEAVKADFQTVAKGMIVK